VTVDALGNPTAVHLTGGQAPDLDGADVLLPHIRARTVLADKGYDADQRMLLALQAAGKNAVIPPRSHRRVQRSYDKDLYKARHLVENFFAKLKLFRVLPRAVAQRRRPFSNSSWMEV